MYCLFPRQTSLHDFKLAVTAMKIWLSTLLKLVRKHNPASVSMPNKCVTTHEQQSRDPTDVTAIVQTVIHHLIHIQVICVIKNSHSIQLFIQPISRLHSEAQNSDRRPLDILVQPCIGCYNFFQKFAGLSCRVVVFMVSHVMICPFA